MNRITITICAAAFLISCGEETKVETKVAAATTIDSTAQAVNDSANAMKNWEAYMTPGKPHKLMTSWNGSWTTDITMWMAPGALPSKTTGTSENSMVLGNRYQVSRHKSKMMGMAFEGISTLAYDNAKKVFVSTWIDNMGTGIMTMEGAWNETAKMIDFKGKMVDPTIGKEVFVRETFHVIDDQTQVMEMYANGPDGKEFKTMEIRFTRKK